MMVCLSLAVACNGSGTDLGSECDNLFARIDKDDKVAVLAVSDQLSGDITALGNIWRDKIEGRLSNRGVFVLPRREIGIINDDMGRFSDEGMNWDAVRAELQADVLVKGEYLLLPADKDGEGTVHLNVKVLKGGRQVVGNCETTQPMQPGWLQLANQIMGTVRPPKSIGRGPALSAVLDKQPACYPDNAAMKIIVNAESGTWLYLFTVDYEGKVLRLYPNRESRELPITVPEYVFPPPSMKDEFGLYVCGRAGQRFSNEAIIVIAARNKIDFSKIPEAWEEGKPGQAARTRDIQQILGRTKDYIRKDLRYSVGPGCGPSAAADFL
jgi:hypothetical protein